jgi:hypothetical protein
MRATAATINKFFFIFVSVLIVKHLLAPKVFIKSPFLMLATHTQHSL